MQQLLLLIAFFCFLFHQQYTNNYFGWICTFLIHGWLSECTEQAEGSADADQSATHLQSSLQVAADTQTKVPSALSIVEGGVYY